MENQRRENILQHKGRRKLQSCLESNRDESVCLPVEETPRLFSDGLNPSVSLLSLIIGSQGKNGVSLGQSDNEANHNNQAIIEEACGLLVDLLQFAVSKGWHHVISGQKSLLLKTRIGLTQSGLERALKKILLKKSAKYLWFLMQMRML